MTNALGEYLKDRKNLPQRALLKKIFGIYIGGMRILKKHRKIRNEDLENVTKIFIRIIDFVYVENFNNRLFFRIINRGQESVVANFLYIILNAENVKLYSTAPEIASLFGISAQTISNNYRDMCKKCDIPCEPKAYGKIILPEKFL